MLIRDARHEEFPEIGDLRVAAYVADGFMRPDSGYASRLHDLGADGVGSVLVAVTEGQEGNGGGNRIVGTIMLRGWPDAGEFVTSPDEAEIRALAVSPEARRAGVGRALVAAVIERAARAGARHLVLCTQTDMKPAHRLYEDVGFVRLPHRDREPEPGIQLLAYGKVLESGG